MRGGKVPGKGRVVCPHIGVPTLMAILYNIKLF